MGLGGIEGLPQFARVEALGLVSPFCLDVQPLLFFRGFPQEDRLQQIDPDLGAALRLFLFRRLVAPALRALDLPGLAIAQCVRGAQGLAPRGSLHDPGHIDRPGTERRVAIKLSHQYLNRLFVLVEPPVFGVVGHCRFDKASAAPV